MRSLFDIDRVEIWGPELRHALSDILPAGVDAIIREEPREYIETASKILFDRWDKGAIVSRCRRWLEAGPIVAFHGTRSSDEEVESIEQRGIIRLSPRERVEFLTRLFSSHPDWPTCEPKLSEIATEVGNGRWGRREGQAHLTLSRLGLLCHYNHYLVEGSEFDGHVGRMLLGNSADAFLQAGRIPHLVTLHVPGPTAFKAGNPFGTADAEMPNIVRDMLTSWAHWLAEPDWRPDKYSVDCGLMFYEDIPASWIMKIEKIEESLLLPYYRPR
jgi:hypothetical protein